MSWGFELVGKKDEVKKLHEEIDKQSSCPSELRATIHAAIDQLIIPENWGYDGIYVKSDGHHEVAWKEGSYKIHGVKIVTNNIPGKED